MVGQASWFYELRPFKIWGAIIKGSHSLSSFLLGLYVHVLECSDDPKIMADTVFYCNLLLRVLVW